MYKPTRSNTFSRIYDQRYLFLMSIPFIIWVFIFKYIPVMGWTMAFQDYVPGRSFSAQEFVGLKHFIAFVENPNFYIIMRNTLVMSFGGLVLGTTIPIIFAIMLNEIKRDSFKKTVQTISYLPYFISWTIVAGLFSTMLSIDRGIVNEILLSLKIIGEPIQFLSEGKYFWSIIITADIWKQLGWNSIIYIAAISGIDGAIYEAAKVDGAGRLGSIINVTLPGIKPTVIVILVMNIGWLLNTGFEKQFLLGNPLVYDYSEVLDLHILNYGINNLMLSYGTAVGIFKSLISIFLVLCANYTAKKIGEGGVI